MRIHVGDEIEYIAKIPIHGIQTDQAQTRKGTVIQVTDRFVTVQGERYPETLLTNDIKTGKIRFLKLITSDGEEYELKRNTRYSHIDWTAIADQARILINEKEISLYKAASIIGKDIKVPSGTVYNRLREASLTPDILADFEPEDISIGGDIVGSQITKREDKDPSTVFDELKKKWIQDVLETALPTAAQMSIIERIISLEGVA